jgi:hypothetical protein
LLAIPRAPILAGRIVPKGPQRMAEPVTVFTPPKSPHLNPSPAAVERNTAPVRSAAAIDGTQSSPASTPAQRAFADMRQRADEMHGHVDPATHAIVRQPDGQLLVRPRADGGASAAPDAGGGQPQPGPAVVGADGKLHVGDYALSADDIKGILAAKAERDSRAANTPKTAADYSLDLPEGFELPAGVSEWRWNLDDPTSAAMLGQAKEWAHAHQIDGPAFSKLLGLYASNQILEQQRFDQARKAEITKLGANVSTRVDAVGTWLEAQLGSHLAHALRQTMVTARSVEAYEKLMRNYISQGVGGNPGGSRDGAGAGPEKISQAEYDGMSYHQKIEYAQRFAAQQQRR